jgi:N-acyl-D-amino-acid deacylase
MIEAARAAGQIVTADQYPYIASSTSLEAMLLPEWAREGSREEVSKRLADAEQLVKMRPYIEKSLMERPHIRIVDYEPNPKLVGKALHELAAEQNRPQLDIAVELMREGNPSAINFGMSEDDVRFVMQLPWVATASDGSVKLASGEMVHPRSFGTFPRKIGLYAVREKVLPVEQAVRSATGLPADILGLKERGYLKPNYFADVTAFKPDAIIDQATFDKPFEPPAGIPWVIVNGKVAVNNGEPTHSLSGKALRHEPKATAAAAAK